MGERMGTSLPRAASLAALLLCLCASPAPAQFEATGGDLGSLMPATWTVTDGPEELAGAAMAGSFDAAGNLDPQLLNQSFDLTAFRPFARDQQLGLREPPQDQRHGMQKDGHAFLGEEAPSVRYDRA